MTPKLITRSMAPRGLAGGTDRCPCNHPGPGDAARCLASFRISRTTRPRDGETCACRCHHVGGTELPLGARLRPTRLEGEDAAGRKVLVEEVKGHGWRWEVRWLGRYQGGAGLSKTQAIEAAARAMRGEGS